MFDDINKIIPKLDENDSQTIYQNLSKKQIKSKPSFFANKFALATASVVILLFIFIPVSLMLNNHKKNDGLQAGGAPTLNDSTPEAGIFPEDDNSSLFKMTNSLVADIRLSNALHGDSGLNTNINAQRFKCIGKRKSIHSGCKHANMIRTGSVHIAIGASAPEISAADYNSNFCSKIYASFDALADTGNSWVIKSEMFFARKGLSAQF